MRPLGLITIWKINNTAPKYEIIKTALFGYYQNAEDYLKEFARAHGWQAEEPTAKQSITFTTGQFRVELMLIEAQGIDLSKESYLFPETENEKENEQA